MAENTTNAEQIVEVTTEYSRSSSDEECEHVKNSVNVKSVRKKISDLKPSELECVTCAKSSGDTPPFTPTIDSVSTDDIPDSSSSSKDVDTSPPKPTMQLCLSCGELHCGRNDKGHAERHFEENKDHTISLNLDTSGAWCYKCDSFVIPATQKNQVISEAQAMVRKHFSQKDSDEEKENDRQESLYKKKGKNISYQVTAPGLNNLGNTCFFNSVMQVVVGTSVLRSVLIQSDHYCDPHIDVSKCITAKEEEVGPLTDAFKNFLREMWRTNDNVVSPRDLFSQISKKWQQFRGWRQQDSQELMRFLFDGVKSEELEHIKKLELQKPPKPQYMETENDYDDLKEDDEDDEEEDDVDDDDDSVRKQKDIKKYESFIDACFGGKLVSVIVCNACKHCSYSYEEFLDVSLPIKSSSKSYPEYGSYSSSYGGSSSGFFLSNIGGSVFDNNDSSNNDGESGNRGEDDNRNEDENSDTEKEEGIPIPSKDEKNRIRLLLRDLPSDSGRSTPNSKDVSLLDCLKSFVKVETLEGDNSFACDNCWKLKKAHIEQKKETNSTDEADEADDTVDTGDSVDPDNNKDDKNPTNGFDPDEDSQDNMEVDDDNDTDNRRTETETETETGSSEVLDNENSSDTSDGVKPNSNEFDNDNDTRINFLTTSKPKSEPEPELDPERPYILRKAFKRYLFASLPPVIVFHLKRFQQVGGRWSVSMRKIDDFVSFDEELDVGDFVVPPEIDKDEKNGINNGHIIDGNTESSFNQNKQRKLSTKYRLYGVVVHLGSLYNGHYIAYVLSGNIRSEGEQYGLSGFFHTDMNSRIRDFERQKHKTGDQRQWIYCSDSSVRAAAVDEVLNSGAYLLFYERVDE